MVICEGIVGNSSVHLAFGNHNDCNSHKVTKCRSRFGDCPVYKMLEVVCDD